jgi:hypothetical protein
MTAKRYEVTLGRDQSEYLVVTICAESEALAESAAMANYDAGDYDSNTWDNGSDPHDDRVVCSQEYET